MRAFLPIGLLMIGCGGGVTPDETPLPGDSGQETGSDAAQEPTDCTGTQPATMVTLPEGYSIDSTEVTRCQYKVWLDTNPSTSGQDPWCAWNKDFTPQDSQRPAACGWPPADEGDLPVVCVDWCDAVAYCRGVGKRLCGKIGGGANGYDDVADATRSQWYNACSSGGLYLYPYGNSYDHGAKCNDADRVKDPKERHATCGGCLPECQSTEDGYAGVYNLSGNVWEWEDSCKGNTSANDFCRMRGGSTMSPDSYATCGNDIGTWRSDAADVIGIRCCSP